VTKLQQRSRRAVSRRASQSRLRRQGAALVEGVMVGAVFVGILACLFVVHRYCWLQLSELSKARELAWQKAMNGCGNDNDDATSLAKQIVDDLVPFLDSVPWSLSSERSFEVTGGPFHPSGRREVKYICNPTPSATKPLTNMIGWLGDMFT
jgi:hypothetical protein